MVRVALGVVLAVALVACADPATVAQDPSPAPSYPAAGVVLRVTQEGGLLPPGARAEVPLWSLLGDGRVLTLGPQITIYPGPAFPNVRVATVSAATVDRIVAAARAAGVDGQQRDYGDPPIADATTTVFRLTTADGTVEAKVYALTEADDTTNAARRKLRELLDHLTDLDGWLGEGTASADETYEPAAVAIYARTYVRSLDPANQTLERDIAWTGPDPAAGESTAAGTCTVLTGETLAKALPDLRRSNTLTRWTFGGKGWSFALRPLLPDERTCADGAG